MATPFDFIELESLELYRQQEIPTEMERMMFPHKECPIQIGTIPADCVDCELQNKCDIYPKRNKE